MHHEMDWIVIVVRKDGNLAFFSFSGESQTSEFICSHTSYSSFDVIILASNKLLVLLTPLGL